MIKRKVVLATCVAVMMTASFATPVSAGIGTSTGIWYVKVMQFFGFSQLDNTQTSP